MWLTLDELCAQRRISRTTLWRIRQDAQAKGLGDLPTVTYGRALVRVPARDADAWFRRLTKHTL